MGIFYRRRLCLLCFLFVGAALAAWFLPKVALLWIGAGILACLIAFSLVFLLRSHPRPVLTVILCLVSVLAALLHSWIRIDLAEEKAERYVGEHTVQAHILDTQYCSEYGAQYVVKLLEIDGGKTGIRARVICNFPTDLSEGDLIEATALLDATPKDRDGCLLSTQFHSGENVSVSRTSQAGIVATLISDSGLEILSHRAQGYLRGLLSEQLGEKVGALASAFLLGDRSALDPEIERDFRRAGVSHMMAVSGLHISVLLGGIELLLRKLYVPKSIRCVSVAVSALVFLFLTGFSLSACRSVLMLFFVYLYYLLQEGNDSLTALFASLALILLISPRAVVDLGLWMSFLATLGLLTLYPLCEKRIRFPKKKGMAGWLLRGARYVLLMAIMTVIANLFLLPVIWIFFGELSLVAVLSNVLLSFPSYLFLLGIPILLITLAVPVLGEGIGWLVFGLGEGMLDAVGVLSRIPMATVSLNYEFCKILIPLFAVAMATLLVVRLKQKRWLFLPPALVVLSFTICFAVTQMTHSTATLRYETDGSRNEILTVTEGDDFSVCDLSGGSRHIYQQVLEKYRDATATEIHTVLLTHYHAGHPSGLELLMRETVIRRICLPTPRDQESYRVAERLGELAHRMGTEVIFYDETAPVSLSETVRATVSVSYDRSAHPKMTVAFYGAERTAVYLSSGIHPDGEILERGDYLIFGSHGGLTDHIDELSFSKEAPPEIVIYTHRALPQYKEFFRKGSKVYAPSEGQRAYAFTLPLS